MKLPGPVKKTIDAFYANNIKYDQDGNERDMSLGSGCPRIEECYLLAVQYLKRKPERSLDFGLGDGSVCITLAACKKYLGLDKEKHVTLDPLQSVLSKGVGLNEIKRYDLEDFVEFHEQGSEYYLYEQHQQEKTFDFVFVDGAHDTGHKVVDAFWIHRVLKPGGFIGFHDSLYFSTSAAVRHLMLEEHYRLVDLNVDPKWRALARGIRHTPRLGSSYCLSIVPKMGKSTTGLVKPKKKVAGKKAHR